MTQAIGTKQLLKINVKGVVQGVGFRPFIYQLAQKHKLKGWVLNTSGSVEIEVEGGKKDLQGFLVDLKENQPPQARINKISVTEKPAVGYKQFEIRPSLAKAGEYQLISPDLATCHDCRQDFLEPTNRRYRYPFTNCTNCGPRFTIIENIPYDRPLTTMRRFQMCPACQAEYDDPQNRRFHAQPNACPVCGPWLELRDAGGNIVPGRDAIATSSQLLKRGAIVAIRGLGGFLFVTDATSTEAVRRLRERKKRPSKPLAVMLADIKEVRKHCSLSSEEEALLTSPASPIVLLKWEPYSSISKLVAPGLGYLGVMLPYTPLHHLLLGDSGRPLVMTSGNLSEEPIARDNDEAAGRLNGIADYFLNHNRDIHSGYDDSVTMVEESGPVIIRRARGYAPDPVHLPFKAGQILACGAEEKNTFCLTREEYAFLSQHIGDMENEETLRHFEDTIALYRKMFRIRPELMAADLHPDYLATKWAQARAEADSIPLISVQHHHAHIVSCMVENGIKEPVIGVAFDGTGYGLDGHIWGGEFMIADYQGFTRRGHFEYLPLPGGAAAIKKPYRTTIGYLYTLLGDDALKRGLPFLSRVDPVELGLIKQQIDRKINAPLTSSCGRLFDAVSALLDIREVINYDAQAAVELEMAADDILTKSSYPFTIELKDGIRIIRLKKLFSGIISDLETSLAVAEISAKFHNTVAQMLVQVCSELAEESGIKTIALSGGVFQNRRLSRQVITALKVAGHKVISHHKVPCNDGGISLGQVVIAHNISKGG